MTTPFSHAVFPPIPALEIRLANPAGKYRSGYLHAFLDTGADTTVAPIELLDQLGIRPSRWDVVYGLWGGQEQVPIFTVDIEVGSAKFLSVDVIGHYEDYILIGRNLSNQLRLLLDGPAETVELVE